MQCDVAWLRDLRIKFQFSGLLAVAVDSSPVGNTVASHLLDLVVPLTKFSLVLTESTVNQ